MKGMKQYLFPVSVITIATLGLWGLSHFLLRHYHWMIALSAQVASFAHYFTLWRYLLFILLIVNWQKILMACHRRLGLSFEATKVLISRRWHVLGFIVLFEVFIAHQGFARLVSIVAPVLL